MSAIAVLTTFLFTVIKYNMALLYGTVGEIVTEKSGSLNLGVEGTMAIGGIGGLLVGCAFDNIFVGILASFICAALCGLLFAFLTVTLQANQNVTGLTITTFGLGLYFFIGNGFKASGKWPDMLSTEGFKRGTESLKIPLLNKIPVIGQALFSHSILIYLGIIISVLVWWYFKYTKPGLRIRAIGENPASADAVGVNITLYKYIHLMLGSGIMGITRYVSLGSCIGAALFPVLVAVFHTENTAFIIISVIIGALAIFKHRTNIARLLKGNESKLNFSK